VTVLILGLCPSAFRQRADTRSGLIKKLATVVLVIRKRLSLNACLQCEPVANYLIARDNLQNCVSTTLYACSIILRLPAKGRTRAQDLCPLLIVFCLLLLCCYFGWFLILRTKAANCFTSLPHFALTQFFQLSFQFLTVINLAVAVD
jgi:hypothetical protein